MIRLVRFFEKEEWAEQFLNGDLFMNSIGHFCKLGEKKNDYAEGVGEVLSPDDFKKRYDPEVIDAFGDLICAPIQNRIEAYKYVHVLCMLMHEYDALECETVRISPEMAKMGKYTVRINNVQAFVDRLFDQMKSNQQFGLMGPVKYHRFNEKTAYRDCFDKNDKFEYEQEWRLALIPDYKEAEKLAMKDRNAEYDKSYIFHVGSLRDIAERVDTRILLGNPGYLDRDEKGRRFKTVKKLSIPWCQRKKSLQQFMNNGFPVPYDVYPEQYVGWGSREAFRQKVIEIDGGAVKPLITIG